jgi:hypothetical protein
MSKQYNKVIKRHRRERYLKRKKTLVKPASATPPSAPPAPTPPVAA